MQLEYIDTSCDLTDAKLGELIKKEINAIPEISTVVVPQYFVKLTRDLLQDTKKVSCLIDYPL